MMSGEFFDRACLRLFKDGVGVRDGANREIGVPGGVRLDLAGC